MRQLFYLLLILNLLLLLWIYGTQQQPEQLQSGHPAIGDLRIVSDEVIFQIKSDAMIDDEVEPEPHLQTQRKHLSPAHYLTPGFDETHVRVAKPDAISTPLKHSSSRKTVTSINGYEVVLPSLNSYRAAARIFDQLQLPAGVQAYKGMNCGDGKCLFFDVSRYFYAAEMEWFDAGSFIQRDSAMM